MHGIGGRTIAEAQARMTYPEFLTWVKFRAKRGSLNTGLRVEVAAARMLAVHFNSQRKDAGFTIAGFAPHVDQPPPLTVEESIKEAMRTWR